jgi:hypothetical protein
MEKLTDNNGIEIFRNNAQLRARVWEDALENDAYYQADEILSYFRHYNAATGRRYETLKDYEISYCGAYVKADPKYKKEFLEDCIKCAEVFGIFDTMHNIKNIFNRVIEKIDLYEDAAAGYYDMSDNNFYRLEKWIDKTIDEAAGYIAAYAQEAYEQFDDPGVLEDYFSTVWLEYNDGLQVDEAGAVYETITTTKIYK